MPSMPMVDWVGASALMMAIVLTFGVVLGRYYAVAKWTQRSFWQIFEAAGLSLGVLVVVGALSHIGISFFTHYYSDWLTAFYWLIGSPHEVSPLASHRTSWIHLFNLFHYIAVAASAWILWKNLKALGLAKNQLAVSFMLSGMIIWIYLGLMILTLALR